MLSSIARFVLGRYLKKSAKSWLPALVVFVLVRLLRRSGSKKSAVGTIKVKPGERILVENPGKTKVDTKRKA